MCAGCAPAHGTQAKPCIISPHRNIKIIRFRERLLSFLWGAGKNGPCAPCSDIRPGLWYSADAGATWAINRLVFVNGGVDNILNVDRRAGFVGVGLRFDDDDMKYLMGSVPIPR